MRILGLDLGDKTLGVAVSDAFLWTAQGVTIIKRNNPTEYKQSLSELEKIIKEYDVSEIVLGYPKNMDNSEGERCEKTKIYKEKLEKRFKDIPVILWDERMSTMAAERTLISADLTRDKRKKVIDKMAAVHILQGYLDYRSKNIEKKE